MSLAALELPAVTRKDLKAVERALEIHLPEAYCSLVLSKPFKKHPELQVLFTDRSRLLEANQRARQGEWPRRCLVVGTDLAGNDYFVDLESPDLSIYLRLHEKSTGLFEARVSSLEDFVDTVEDELGLEAEINLGPQAARLLARVEQLWFLAPAEAEQALPGLSERAPKLGARLAFRPAVDLGTRLARLGMVLEQSALNGRVLMAADRPPFLGCLELRDVGSWLARGRKDAVIQRMAVSGKRAEEAGHPGAAAAFYSEAQRLGADARSAIDRLAAAGHPVDERYARFIEKLEAMPEWPTLTNPFDPYDDFSADATSLGRFSLLLREDPLANLSERFQYFASQDHKLTMSKLGFVPEMLENGFTGVPADECLFSIGYWYTHSFPELLLLPQGPRATLAMMSEALREIGRKLPAGQPVHPALRASPAFLAPRLEQLSELLTGVLQAHRLEARVGLVDEETLTRYPYHQGWYFYRHFTGETQIPILCARVA